jgi:hypothetical protein
VIALGLGFKIVVPPVVSCQCGIVFGSPLASYTGSCGLLAFTLDISSALSALLRAPRARHAALLLDWPPLLILAEVVFSSAASAITCRSAVSAATALLRVESWLCRPTPFECCSAGVLKQYGMGKSSPYCPISWVSTFSASLQLGPHLTLLLRPRINYVGWYVA